MSAEQTTLPQVEPRYGWILSLSFWICLLIAAILYALVFLSPRLLRYFAHRQTHFRNQTQLVKLERQSAYLSRVVHALETDRRFAAELARIEFASVGSGERIAVERRLQLDAVDRPTVTAEPPIPWYVPILTLFVEHPQFRQGSLIAAAVIVLIAFTFLHESQELPLRRVCRETWHSISRAAGRYRRRE